MTRRRSQAPVAPTHYHRPKRTRRYARHANNHHHGAVRSECSWSRLYIGDGCCREGKLCCLPYQGSLTNKENHDDHEPREAMKRRSMNRIRDYSHRDGDMQLLCPHCQSRGTVQSKTGKAKKGVSGGKATAAVFTGGISLLGTGLSRRQPVTVRTCSNCKTKWEVQG
jgi:hypothetical protein